MGVWYYLWLGLVGNRRTGVGESQRNLWLQAQHLKNIDTKPVTTTHTGTVTKYSDSSRTTPTHHRQTHVGCTLGPAIEPASALTVDTTKPR